MNNSIDIIKKIYKPYRYTKKGNVTILESTSGTLVIKDRKKNLNELFNYLNSRNFNNYPKLIDDSRADIDVYEFIDDIKYPKEQKAHDLINIIAKLHYKTFYYKDVTEDNFKEIYENILSNINYLNEIYDNYYDDFFKEIYLSPSKYLFMRNYSKIKANLSFCKDELDNWYNLVKNTNKTRVSIVHNNLSLDHFLKSNGEYLISWDNYIIDTPIIDLVNFYKKEYFNINFENLINSYNSIFKLTDEELKLFLLLICIPPEIKFSDNEFNSTIDERLILDYIYKTENLIRPYYSKNKEKENSNFNK